MPETLTGLDLFGEELGSRGPDTLELALLVSRLLKVIADHALEAPGLDTSEFTQALGRFRSELVIPGRADRIRRTGGACLATCRDFFERSRDLLGEREDEFSSVIDVLREALAALAGDAANFNSRLLGSSQRFRQLAEVDDIRELRKQLKQEVGVLQRVVEERQQRDAAYVAKLSRQVEALEARVIRTTAEALLDALTGIPNRRAFDRTIDQWTTVGTTSPRRFVLGMADLDDFKRLNDQHGHLIGDRVLICAAHSLKRAIRSTDLLARYGGEEFVLLMDDVSIEDAQRRVGEAVAQAATLTYRYESEGRPVTVGFTFSCGLTDFVPGDRVDDLLERVGRALSEAKSGGKNQVVVWRNSFLRGLFGQKFQRRRTDPSP